MLYDFLTKCFLLVRVAPISSGIHSETSNQAPLAATLFNVKLLLNFIGLYHLLDIQVVGCLCGY